MKDFKTLLFEEFNIAVINKNKKIWMLRTEIKPGFVSSGNNNCIFSFFTLSEISLSIKREYDTLFHPRATYLLVVKS